MRNLLGWAIATVVLLVLAHFGILALGATPTGAANLAAFFISLLALVSSAGIAHRGVVLPTVLTALTAFFFSCGVAFAAAVTAALTVFCVLIASGELKIKFRHAFPAYLIEGLGIYGTLKLGAWWPAALAVVVLGAWWLWLHVVEKKEVPAIV